MIKRANKGIIAISLTICFLAVGLFLCGFYTPSPSETLQTYFSYSPEELQSLNDLTSDKTISDAEVNQWVTTAFDLVKKNHKKIDASRVYAYLFTAQQDAAALSYQSKKKLSGNLTAVSTKTLCLLLPDECSSIPPAEKSDDYSSKISEIVFKKIAERFHEEENALATAPTSAPPLDWKQDASYFGRAFGQAKPWLITTGNQFRLDSPQAYGTAEIQLQKKELQDILSSLTKHQLEASQKWAAGRGTISSSGQWIEMANQYIEKRQIPLERALVIRAILSQGIEDATIAYIDSKYTHWKRRPAMLFPELKTNLKTPKHPSYPSGHATIAMAAAIIMDYYFPENQAQWDKTAEEVGNSRLWAGVHFPIDDHDGLELGHKIGSWIVEKLKSK